ncbi:hypothetical protein CLU79DRAFT_741096 [Phycomyces nitens]|nr:hypothetical protein CLU79DRAFT_741096 [Phycomyces nitens]
MISESPANAGHAFVNDAEDYEERGDWVNAAEAHLHAAEQFQRAMEFAQDTVASKALSLLTNAHRQKAQDIQRRQLRVQAKDNPSIVQSVTNTGYTTMRDLNMNGLRNALPDAKRLDPTQTNVSTGAIGDSYALLSNDTDEEDDSDPFNKFWQVVETLVEKLSNPVAFASAPLSENDKPTPTRAGVEQDDSQGKQEISAMLESYFVVPDHTNMENTRILPERQKDSTRDKKREAGKEEENEQLKLKVEQLTKKIRALEKTAEESNMLKSSILQFRNDVQKQAKRIMLNHDSTMRSSAFGAGSTMASTYGSYTRGSTGPSPDIAQRLKELEEENRQLRLQNDKQQTLVNKYRERWEKLKESAKKRRSQPSEEVKMESLLSAVASYLFY